MIVFVTLMRKFGRHFFSPNENDYDNNYDDDEYDENVKMMMKM